MLDDDQQQNYRLAVETLDELEWCLEHLESMQTHRSVADMAANKVGDAGRLAFLLLRERCLSVLPVRGVNCAKTVKDKPMMCIAVE